MYKATVIEIFIASPSDVQQERAMVREVINDWNSLNSKSRKVVLKALGWENDVYSSFNEGSAQESINKQILESSDLLVGIFWTKVGTPTEKYASGSIEEITKHIEAGKPTLIFFSKAPVKLDSVDDEQYKKLNDFKAWCQQKGVYREYDETSSFAQLFTKQLTLAMNQDPKILEMLKQHQITESEKQPQTTKPENKLPSLSSNAISLLKEMAEDPSGILLSVSVLAGFIYQTNGKSFTISRMEARKKAEFDRDLQELERYNLIKANGYKQDSFSITAKGYELVESLK